LIKIRFKSRNAFQESRDWNYFILISFLWNVILLIYLCNIWNGREAIPNVFQEAKNNTLHKINSTTCYNLRTPKIKEVYVHSEQKYRISINLNLHLKSTKNSITPTKNKSISEVSNTYHLPLKHREFGSKKVMFQVGMKQILSCNLKVRYKR